MSPSQGTAGVFPNRNWVILEVVSLQASRFLDTNRFSSLFSALPATLRGLEAGSRGIQRDWTAVRVSEVLSGKRLSGPLQISVPLKGVSETAECVFLSKHPN